MRLVSLLLLVCCSSFSSFAVKRSTTLYVTDCGMVAEEFYPTLQAAETRIVNRFSKLREYRGLNICKALSGWKVKVHPIKRSDSVMCNAPNAWVLEPYGLCVLGFTDIEERTVWIGDAKFFDNSLAHEIVHVLDLAFKGHAGHCNFVQRGVEAALQELTGLPDGSVSELDCPPFEATEACLDKPKLQIISPVR